MAVETQSNRNVLVNLATFFRKKKWMVTTAESCTGGLVAAAMTSIPESSLWFERGYIVYSNEAKTEMLGVPAKLIATYGAVSAEVAASMAEGALKHSRANCSLAITGIAGPHGGSCEKPVGLVWTAYASQNGPTETNQQQWSGDRLAVCEQAKWHGLQGLLTYLYQQKR